MTPPTPSTAASSSTLAASIASSVPNARATARAPVGPTWRMPSATSSRLRGRARGRVDGAHQVAGRDLGEALQLHQLLDGEAVEVGGIVGEAGRDELEHTLLAQALNVHGRARRVVSDALHPLGRAVDVRAVGVALTGQADERLAARRACRRELPLRLAPLGHARPSP